MPDTNSDSTATESDRTRVLRFGRQLLWAFVLSLQMFAYLIGIAAIATATHFVFVLLERFGVDSGAVDLWRWIAWAVEVILALIFAGEAVITEYRVARDRLRS